MEFDTRLRREGERCFPVLVWQWATPMRSIASSPYGGGMGLRRWVVNAQIPRSYARRDPENHLAKLGVSLGLRGKGVGMLTAVDVRTVRCATDAGVEVAVTVGLDDPILAAAPEEHRASRLAGTINVVAVLPEALSDAAMVNAIGTITEAKAQAVRDLGLDATGTPTDAACVLCPDDGPRHAFGGPRSRWGNRLARAVHAAVIGGVVDGVPR